MNTGTAYAHIGGKNLNEARMMFKLKLLDPAAPGILECALQHDPMAVEQIIEEGGLGDVPGHDKRWMALLSSLHTLGSGPIKGEREDYPAFFQHWWDTYYPNLSEWEMEDLTVFGSSTHASEFDGLRNIRIDY